MPKFFFLVLVAASVFVSASLQPNITIAQDDTTSAKLVRNSWPRFLGKQFDGVGLPDDNIDWTAQPKFQWSLDVGLGYGIGAINNGSYYHFDATDNPQRERLRCIDMSNGQIKWTQSYPIAYVDYLRYEEGPRSSPTISDGRIYTMGVTGQLTCRNLADGKKQWSVDTNKKYGVIQNFFGVGGAPLIFDGKVIVMVGGSPPEDQEIAPMRLDRVSPDNSALVAFDAATGKELWKGGDDLASYSSPRPIQVDGETMLLLFARDHLLCIDPTNGKQLWAFKHRAKILESVNAMVPIIDKNHVFISECYSVGSVLLKVSRDSAEVVWRDRERARNRNMNVHWSNPVLMKGHLFGCSGRNAPDSDFRCVELMTGDVKWKDERLIRSAVTQIGDLILVLEERGFAQVIRANTKKLDVVAEWKLQLAEGNRPALEYPCWAAPIVLGDSVLVRGDERVLCLKLQQK